MITGNSIRFSTLVNKIVQRSFAFKKFDYTDGLNFKSLLNDEELMVI